MNGLRLFSSTLIFDQFLTRKINFRNIVEFDASLYLLEEYYDHISPFIREYGKYNIILCDVDVMIRPNSIQYALINGREYDVQYISGDYEYELYSIDHGSLLIKNDDRNTEVLMIQHESEELRELVDGLEEMGFQADESGVVEEILSTDQYRYDRLYND